MKSPRRIQPRIINKDGDNKIATSNSVKKDVNISQLSTSKPENSLPEAKIVTPDVSVKPKVIRRTISQSDANVPVQSVKRKTIGNSDNKELTENSKIDLPFRPDNTWPPFKWGDIDYKPSVDYKSSPDYVKDETIKAVNRKLESSAPTFKPKIIAVTKPEAESIVDSQEKNHSENVQLKDNYDGIPLPDSVPPREYHAILNWLASACGDDVDFSYTLAEPIEMLAINMWAGQLEKEIYEPRINMAKNKTKKNLFLDKTIEKTYAPVLYIV